MAKAQKFETIEEVVAAMGVELNDQTRPFLESFVKKAGGGVSVGAKKKALFEEVEAMGVEGLKLDTETMDSLKVRGCQYLYTMGMLEELDEFANRFNLAVDHESGAVHRVKSKVKPIEERNAGKKEGGSDEEEAPVEETAEAPAEDAPSEETADENSSAEETPAEETPAE